MYFNDHHFIIILIINFLICNTVMEAADIYDLVRVTVCLPVIGVSLEVYSILKQLYDFVSVHFDFE